MRSEEVEQELQEEVLPDPWELNNTARSDVELLFFNRVPKVGSQTFMELLRRLAIRNQFGFHRDAVQRVETIRLAPADQQVLVSLVSAHTPPASYIKHVCYTNFTRASKEHIRVPFCVHYVEEAKCACNNTDNSPSKIKILPETKINCHGITLPK
ncbi:jg2763 [Pararge aegeria aegeria]|uniref:Jg2763 protein n=1 Tax=Pararge aegeria aegeria TaxID=348720 RepID=A0A8S4QPA2_9NEOP|nr:jg2763 [Pararge aegeria aegeria]